MAQSQLVQFVRGFMHAMQTQISQGDTIRAGDAADRILAKAHLSWRALDNSARWTDEDAYWMGHDLLQASDADIQAATGLSASGWRKAFDRLTSSTRQGSRLASILRQEFTPAQLRQAGPKLYLEAFAKTLR